MSKLEPRIEAVRQKYGLQVDDFCSLMAGRLEEKHIPEPMSGCWIWTGSLSKFGYGKVNFRGVMIAAHRLSFYLAGKPLRDGQYILHSCDNRACVNPDHLRAGSPVDNNLDMYVRNRRPSGENSHLAKLSASDVFAAIEMRKRGLSYSKIGKHFGVHGMTINEICRGTSWSHVTGIKENV